MRDFAYARHELMEKQAARLEAELEEARLEERNRMMEELRAMKLEADRELFHQKQQFEDKFKTLKEEQADIFLQVLFFSHL